MQDGFEHVDGRGVEMSDSVDALLFDDNLADGRIQNILADGDLTGDTVGQMQGNDIAMLLVR